MTLGIGLHLGVPHVVYHADPCERPSLSPHLAWTLLKRSALHARLHHPRLGGAIDDSPGEAADKGSIVHDLLLGGGQEFVAIHADDWRTKAAREAREAERAAGKIPMLAHRLQEAIDTAKHVTDHLARSGHRLASKAETEVTAVWESDGCLCRCRIDELIMESLAIRDLKTTEDASRAATPRNVFAMGYHVQAAANIEAIETLIPDSGGRVTFEMLFAEFVPPYAVTSRDLSGDFLDLGRRQWMRAKRIWSQCLFANAFPGYRAHATLSAPTYALAEEMEAAIEQAGKEPF